MSNIFLSQDPYPEIEPSLLNSADIHDYVMATGMIEPYDFSKLKSGSYEVNFTGIVYYWDENGKEQSIDMERERKFLLRKNSIAFLFTATRFCLPDYMALRFNLKITHVHRGLLLGTGPLVDPGFEGNLLIPLHNLTTNDYEFTLNEGLIWVEFTKLSSNPRWRKKGTPPARTGVYKDFPNSKKNKDAPYYFGKAAWGRGIRSSIPDAMSRTAEDAKQSRISAEKARKSARRWSIGTAIAVVVAVIGLFVSIFLGFQPVLQLVQESVRYIKEDSGSFSRQHSDLIKRVQVLEQKLVQIENQNINTTKKVDSLERKLIPKVNEADISSP